MAGDEEIKSNPNDDQQPKWFTHQTDNFNTLYFGKVPEHIVNRPDYVPALQSNLIQLITDPRNKPIRNQVLQILKKNDSRALLVQLLEDPDQVKHRRDILIVAWETGMDFSPWLLHFARLIPGSDFETFMELITVMEEMNGSFNALQLQETLSFFRAETDPQRLALLEPLRDRFQQIHSERSN